VWHGTKVIERVKDGGPDWLPANTPQWLSGRVSFGASLFQTSMSSQATRIIVQLDDLHERQLSVVSFCVANARYFGGGMKIAPGAKLQDGKFDVICVGDLSALKLLTSAPRVYLGSHLSMAEVSHTLAAKVHIRAGGGMKRFHLKLMVNCRKTSRYFSDNSRSVARTL
jgi:diacylglycerol kinase family enzyme